MQSTSDIKLNESKLTYIDSLRGIAILMVVVTHADKFIQNLTPPVQAIVDFGQMGVQLFFIVSAFTLCLTLDKRNQEDKSLTKFYLRRFFRIAPLYYFGILLYFIYFSFIEPMAVGEDPMYASKYTFNNIAANILFINDFTPGPANNKIVPGGWSIGTETTFYALFPLIFFVYKKFEKVKHALLAIPIITFAICFVTLQIVLSFSDFTIKNNSFLYFNIISQLPVFLIGMSLYFKLKNTNAYQNANTYLIAIGFLLSSAFAFGSYVSFKSMAFFVPTITGISFLFLFLLLKKVAFLNSKILSRIGQLSYSIYLFHFIFAWEGSRLLNGQLQGVLSPELIFLTSIILTLGLSVIFALFSEKFIEKSGIDLGRYIITKLGSKERVAKYTPPQTIILKQDVKNNLEIN